MGKYLALFLLCVVGMDGVWVSEAHATPLSDSLAYCQGLRAGGGFAKPIVQCFTDATQGVIPVVTTNFLIAAKAFYMPLAQVLFTLAIIFYGIKLITGNVSQPKGETFALLIKIAAIVYFLGEAPTLYQDMVIVVQGLGDSISAAATSINGNGFCNGNGNTGSSMLWDRWDCIFDFLFKPSLAKAGLGIGAFLFLMLVTVGSGILIFFVGVYFIIALFFVLARFVHIYLMAVLALSFMFCMSYLFFPLLLFRGTAAYFKKWVNICIAYMLTPIIMLGFMGMMLVALDITIFSGQYSVWHQVAGQNAGPASNAFNDASAKTTSLFKSLFHVGFHNSSSDNSTTVPQTADAGTLGTMRNEGQRGSDFEAESHPFMANLGFSMTGLDIGALASAQGKTKGRYIVDILISLISAALLTYVMYSLLTYIPDLASDLVSQGTHAGGIVKTRVFGEAAARATVELAQTVAIETAQAVATGGGSLAATAGKVATKMAVQQAAKMATKRKK